MAREKHYVIEATAVGHGDGADPWRQGAVVPAGQLRYLGLARLLDLGAIREATAEEVKAAEAARRQAEEEQLAALEAEEAAAAAADAAEDGEAG